MTRRRRFWKWSSRTAASINTRTSPRTALEALKTSESPGYFLIFRYWVKAQGFPYNKVSACTHTLGITGDGHCSRCGDELEKKDGSWVSKQKVNRSGRPGGPVLAALQRAEQTWRVGVGFTHHLWCICGRPNYMKGQKTLYTQCLEIIGEASGKASEIGPEHLGAGIVLAKEREGHDEGRETAANKNTRRRTE